MWPVLIPLACQAANEALGRSQADKAALAEECAALKGRVTALEDQLASVAAASNTTEAARANALEDASRLRGEVAAALAERNSANAEAARLRGELDAARCGRGRERRRAVVHTTFGFMPRTWRIASRPQPLMPATTVYPLCRMSAKLAQPCLLAGRRLSGSEMPLARMSERWRQRRWLAGHWSRAPGRRCVSRAGLLERAAGKRALQR